MRPGQARACRGRDEAAIGWLTIASRARSWARDPAKRKRQAEHETAPASAARRAAPSAPKSDSRPLLLLDLRPQEDREKKRCQHRPGEVVERRTNTLGTCMRPTCTTIACGARLNHVTERNTEKKRLTTLSRTTNGCPAHARNCWYAGSPWRPRGRATRGTRRTRK